MQNWARSSAQIDELTGAPSWQSQLGILKARLMPANSDQPGTTLQMQRQLHDCSAELDRLQAILNLQFDGRQQQESKFSSLQLKAMRAQRLADIDSLTSLPNRRYFLRKFARVLSGARPHSRALAVMFMDINDFKQINDRHGHETGDKVLRIVARRLTRSVRSDDLVSRMGGDEFACVLTSDASRDSVERIAAKLLAVVSAPAMIGSLRLSVRPSVGIALFPGDGMNTASLLRGADAAMYHAKQRRTGCEFFDGCSPRPTVDALQV
jgi:diguanylate cyclase (GGDEF)-like protein